MSSRGRSAESGGAVTVKPHPERKERKKGRREEKLPPYRGEREGKGAAARQESIETREERRKKRRHGRAAVEKKTAKPPSVTITSGAEWVRDIDREVERERSCCCSAPLTHHIRMIALFNKLLDWFKALFWKEEMELTLVGLQYSGKTTFVNVIASGQFSEDMIPTVGFNMRKITKGNVTIKLWDIGGQPRFRSMWERYCRGVSAIVYMVDAADPEKIEASKNELHNLLDKPQLQGIPVLVLGNKRDLPGSLDEKELIERMNLSAIQDREICCYSISCKEKDNIDITLQWLIQHSRIRRS
ncbi:hypothetical protein MHYP_G00264960 [Metynnis hypsauchen]